MKHLSRVWVLLISFLIYHATQETILFGKEANTAVTPNELGYVYVLEYHLISGSDLRFGRSPEKFSEDIDFLVNNNYYPVNVSELVLGEINIPFGKTPVALTFDDSSITQFHVIASSNTKEIKISPNCAVGILLEKHKQYGNLWPLKASFYPLISTDKETRNLFGQKEYREWKLKFIVDNGMEIGSHTLTHLNLKTAKEEEIRRQLALSKHIIESYVPGYKVKTLAVPFGYYPKDLSILMSGKYKEYEYEYIGVLHAYGGRNVSPYSTLFNPYRIRRIEVGGVRSLQEILKSVHHEESLRYVSDGNPNCITIPANLPQKLGKVHSKFLAKYKVIIQ
jgi:peptidoglycan/xylan/chitin deacetylase (PgdA/CDA1 family)